MGVDNLEDTASHGGDPVLIDPYRVCEKPFLYGRRRPHLVAQLIAESDESRIHTLFGPVVVRVAAMVERQIFYLVLAGGLASGLTPA
jgi:hypothetical protein